MFLIGPAIWWNAVFLVSIFPNIFGAGFHVLALPADFYPWMATIIGAVFFSPVVSKVAGSIGLPNLQVKRYTLAKPMETLSKPIEEDTQQ